MSNKKKYKIIVIVVVGIVFLAAGIKTFYSMKSEKNNYVAVIESQQARNAYDTAYGIQVIKGCLLSEPETAAATAGLLKNTVIKMSLSEEASKYLHALLSKIEAGSTDTNDKMILELICNTFNGKIENKTPEELVNCIEKGVKNTRQAFYSSNKNQNRSFRNNEKERNDFENVAKRILNTRGAITVAEYSPSKDLIICYCKNIYLEISRNNRSPIFLYYDCKVKEIQITEEECANIARAFTLRNLPKKTKVTNVVVKTLGTKDSIASFVAYINEKTIWLNIRQDTGSVIYFDASQFFTEL